ncbi:PREDICTED: cysteine-rich receptor-like protein kinase 45 [Camelina sativa]|uniref:Cysteine-rich receptor-like protein kinase 45 n=1 Tax=Camelina sativa TaxID=90675 RepID=A0ABM1QF79_CAMSA|nr:PREDICTED: cysteine-rich receptor-like protein kinase 45 [Camelina sativa]
MPQYKPRENAVAAASDDSITGNTILLILGSLVSPEYKMKLKNVMRCWNRGEAIDVIHEVMREEEREDSISEILRYIHIALLCIDEDADTRPSIDKVLHWFSCLSTPLPEPFIGNRFLAEEETNLSWSPSLSPGHSSVSFMSPISSRQGY